MARVSPLLIRTLESSVRVSMIGLANSRAGEDEGSITHLVADLRLHGQRDEIVLIDRWPNDQRVAKLLVLESAEHCGRCLFVEIQLRHRLVAGDFDLGLLLSAVTTRGLARNSASESSLRSTQRDRHLGHGKDGELAAERIQAPDQATH